VIAVSVVFASPSGRRTFRIARAGDVMVERFVCAHGFSIGQPTVVKKRCEFQTMVGVEGNIRRSPYKIVGNIGNGMRLRVSR